MLSGRIWSAYVDAQIKGHNDDGKIYHFKLKLEDEEEDLPILKLYWRLAHHVFDEQSPEQESAVEVIDAYLNDMSSFTGECEPILDALSTGHSPVHVPQCGSCPPRTIHINNEADWYREAGKAIRCDLDAKANICGKGPTPNKQKLPKCAPYLVLIMFFILVLVGVSLAPPVKTVKSAQGGGGIPVSWTPAVESA